MSSTRLPLNARQLDVLGWIVEGCPGGVMAGFTHKHSAQALANRRLVTVSRRGGTWLATPTEAGRYYLTHGRYPDDTGTDRTRPRPRPGEFIQRKQSVGETEPASVALAANVAALRVAPTTRLIADVVSAGGSLEVDRNKDGVNYEMLVKSAIRFGKVPDGKLLVIEQRRGWGNLTVHLRDRPLWQAANPPSIPVPAMLRKPHRVLTDMQKTQRLPVTKSVQSRALRLLHALATEAESRGYAVAVARRDRLRGVRASASPLLTITVNNHGIGLRLWQQIDRTPHVPTAAEMRERAKYQWHYIPKHDEHPSQRLSIQLTNGREYRTSSWTDTKTNGLEHHLTQILQEIELRATFAEEARLEQERAQVERQRQWEAAMGAARSTFRESRRASALNDQAERWQHLKLLHSYVAAMVQAADLIDDPSSKGAAMSWINWCTEYLACGDQLAQPLQMPPDPNPTPAELKPFLHGWSPYGPGLPVAQWR